MKPFLTLLRKDWRVNRAAGAGIVLLVVAAAPYVISLIAYWSELHQAQVGHWPDSARFSQDALGGAMFGALFLGVAGAALGGTTFAAERRERSAEFLAMMPTPRWMIILSKLTVAFACLLAVWLVHAVVYLIAGELLNPNAPTAWSFRRADELTFLGFTAFALATFGFALLFSTFLASAAISASLAIAITVILAAYLTMQHERLTDWEFFVIARLICMVGIISLIIGTICYFKRVAP